MRARSVLPMILTLCITLAVAGSVQAKSKPHACVRFARTWDGAVAEAKLLHVPIVVHNHGFFCPPCWGMHSALLQNKKYIAFADDHTVEVIVLGSLDQGIENEDPRAAEYEMERDGTKVKCMLEFPGMTRDEMLALGRSKAASYNQTGGVPYTCVVDPFTLEELKSWRGGAHSAKSIMEEIETLHDQITEAHGKGLRRGDLRKYEEAEAESREKTERGEFSKALRVLEKASRKSDEWPEALQARLRGATEAVAKAATEAVDALEKLGSEDAEEAKRRLLRLRAKVRGTELEARVKSLLEALASK